MSSRRTTSAIRHGLAVSAGVLAAAVAGLASAQAPSPSGKAKAGQDVPAAKATREQELEALRAEQTRAQEQAARLKADIQTLGEDRVKLNAALISTASKVRGIEERITAAEIRIRKLEADEQRIRQSLKGRHAVIAEILAALQRIGRRPPPAMMVRPEDALQSVRTAMLLNAVLPDMRKDADSLAAELSQLVRLRADIASERDRLSSDLAGISDERTRVALLESERQRKLAETERAFETERVRASAIARQADNLKDLIARMEKDITAAARAAGHASRADSKSDGRQNLAALKDPGRLTPAMAFASAKGALPLPVSGMKLREFGAPDGLGGTERGLSIASRPGAQVTAPCDGWVVYAGPFRSYGQLLILNAGGGYHVLLAGMERISVDLGQFVLTGEPVAVMGSGPQTAAAIATGSSLPTLYVEFRKDGVPVDPTPWWAATDNEKVRG